jgi:CSLREA domain-containing protein
MRRFLFLGLIAISFASFLSALAPGWPGTTSAATFTVTKTDDTADGACDSDCSLREAIIAANAAPGDDVVTLPSGTYNLTLAGANEDAAATGDLDITDGLTLDGAGAATTIVDGGGTDRVFDIDPPSGSGIVIVSLNDLTAQNGGGVSGGGGIRNGDNLTITHVNVRGNTAQNDGGGIVSTAASEGVTISESAVTGNTAPNRGGIQNDSPGMTIVRSLVSENSAPGETGSTGGGGGIWNTGGLFLTNSTVSGNTSDGVGAGITNTTGGTITVLNATISQNTATGTLGAGGLYVEGASATLTNSIIAGNAGGASADCAGLPASFTSGGHNIDGGANCNLTGTGDQQNTDPLLGPLADNGGFSETHALQSASPAIDAGDDSFCSGPSTDQRGSGFPRSLDGDEDGTAACDIGAYEFNPAQQIPSPSPTSGAQPSPTATPAGSVTGLPTTGRAPEHGGAWTVPALLAAGAVVAAGAAVMVTARRRR